MRKQSHIFIIVLMTFLIILSVSIAGCSSTSPSASSTTQPGKTSVSSNSAIGKVTHAKFCVEKGDANSYGGASFESPLTYVKNGLNPYFEMPIEPGNYKIVVTTSNPNSVANIELSYKKFVKSDKFGTPMYEYQSNRIGTSDRNADLNTDISIPDGSIEGKIKILRSNSIDADNCGTISVGRYY